MKPLLGLIACLAVVGCKGDSLSQSDQQTLEQKLSGPINGAAMNGRTPPPAANPKAPKMGGPPAVGG